MASHLLNSLSINKKSMTKNKIPVEHFENLLKVEDTYWWHLTRYHYALALINTYKNRSRSKIRLADLGCGTGGFLRFLKKNGYNGLVGYDQCDLGKNELHRHQIQIEKINFSSSFKLNERPFDIITVMDVLEHIADEKTFICSLKENLASTGLLLVTVPAFQHLNSFWDEKLGHYRRYSRANIKSLLTEADFELLTCSYFFSFLYPGALIRKLAGSNKGSAKCEFPRVPNMLNDFLIFLGKIEQKLMGHYQIPFGVSVVALARKK